MKPPPDFEPADHSTVRWLVNRMHVGTPNRELLKDIRERTKGQSRHVRRYAYAAALNAHNANRGLYADVMNAELGNPEPRPRYYFNRNTKETRIVP